MMMNPTLGQEAVAPLPISRCRPNSSVLGDPSVQTNMSAQSSMFSQKLGQRLIGLNRNNFGSGLPAESSIRTAKQDSRAQCLGRLRPSKHFTTSNSLASFNFKEPYKAALNGLEKAFKASYRT